MTKQTIHKQHSKKFLSDHPSEFGTICYEVSSHRYDPTETYSMSATLRIQDCYETINLDFYVGDSEEKYNKRIDKLQGLIDELEDMKFAMMDGFMKMKDENELLLKDENFTKENNTNGNNSYKRASDIINSE